MGAPLMPADRAHHGPDGRFRNPWPGGRTASLTALPRWTFQRLVARMRGTLPQDPPAASFPRTAPAIAAPRAAPDALRVTWVGHSTCLLQVGGLNILTDPVWSEWISPLPGLGPRRMVPAAFPLAQLPPLDLVLLSHDHYDHFDVRTIRALAAAHPAARWVAPLGVARQLTALGAAGVTELDWWESRDVATPGGLVHLTATPAQHFAGRTPWGRDRTLWCGWSLRVAARAAPWRVFFAGDTGLHPEFGRIGVVCGPFDAALLPIGAYEPRWFMQPVHLNPEEAVEAYMALTAAAGAGAGCAFVPIHWGTIKLTDEPLDEPPRRLREAWARRGLAAADLWILRHGETRVAPGRARVPAAG